jgi:hypothetical protein
MPKANEGLPPLEPDASCVSRFEFMHPLVFYIPVGLYALWLMIKHRSIMAPTLANPDIFAGGAVGERKSDVLNLAGAHAKPYIAPFAVLQKTTVEETLVAATKKLEKGGLSYPLVAKPETGMRGAGVRPINTTDDLKAYLASFPDGRDVMLQKKIEHPAEAGVFYIRHPHEEKGRIFSLTLKYAATVVGDGTHTLKDLILACPRCFKMKDVYLTRHRSLLDKVLQKGEEMPLNFAGNHARGAIFRNGAQHITPEMTATFDSVARDFPNLHFARFDVRFSSLDSLKKGGAFSIVEVNGVGAEATHIWDCDMKLKEAYKVLAQQWRHAFEIGSANRAREHTLPSTWRILKIWVQELLRADDYPLAH